METAWGNSGVSLFDDQWPPQNMTIVIESMLLYDQVHDNSMLANGSDTNWWQHCKLVREVKDGIFNLWAII